MEHTPEKRKNLLTERIESARLRLVPISMEYKDDIFAEYPRIAVFMSTVPAKDISETERFISNSLRSMKSGSNLQFVITEKGSGEFLGCAGLHHIDTPTPDAGIWLKKAAHGNGYGKEAVAAMKEWADAHLSYDYIVYPVVKENAPSRAVAESLGGTIARAYDKKTSDGRILHIVEYRIPAC